MTRRNIMALTALIAMAVIFTASAYFYRMRTFRRTDYALNTVITITASGSGAEAAERAAIGEIRRIDAAFNAHSQTSELAKLNGSPSGEWVHVSDELFALIEKALKISAKTDLLSVKMHTVLQSIRSIQYNMDIQIGIPKRSIYERVSEKREPSA